MATRYRITKVFLDGPAAGSSVEFTTTVEFRKGDSVRFPARGYAFKVTAAEKIGGPRPFVRKIKPAEVLESLPVTSAGDAGENAVRQIYSELRGEWNVSNAPIIAVHKRSREMLGPTFKARYRKQFSEGDCDSIPGLDDVAQTIECEFGFVRSTEQLFEILKQPTPRAPSRDELMKVASAFVAETPADDSGADFNFGHNLTF